MTKARAMMRSGRFTKTEEARKSGTFIHAKPPLGLQGAFANKASELIGWDLGERLPGNSEFCEGILLPHEHEVTQNQPGAVKSRHFRSCPFPPR